MPGSSRPRASSRLRGHEGVRCHARTKLLRDAGLAFRSVLENGDAFALTPMIARHKTPYRTRLQLIEGDRCCNPENKRDTDQLAGGIEMDDLGAPVAYHFCGSTRRLRADGPKVGPARGFRQRHRASKRAALVRAPADRPNARHSLPRAGDRAAASARYLHRSRTAGGGDLGMFTVFIKTEGGEALPVDGEDGPEPEYKLGSGAVITGAPGIRSRSSIRAGPTRCSIPSSSRSSAGRGCAGAPVRGARQALHLELHRGAQRCSMRRFFRCAAGGCPSISASPSMSW